MTQPENRLKISAWFVEVELRGNAAVAASAGLGLTVLGGSGIALWRASQSEEFREVLLKVFEAGGQAVIRKLLPGSLIVSLFVSNDKTVENLKQDWQSGKLLEHLNRSVSELFDYEIGNFEAIHWKSSESKLIDITEILEINEEVKNFYSGAGKAVNDLQNWIDVNERNKSQLNDQIQNSYKKIKKTFEELHEALMHREVELLQNLTENKSAAFKLVAKREARANELKLQTCRLESMNHQQLNTLRSEIESFVDEQHVDEKLECSLQVTFDKEILTKVIPSIGKCLRPVASSTPTVSHDVTILQSEQRASDEPTTKRRKLIKEPNPISGQSNIEHRCTRQYVDLLKEKKHDEAQKTMQQLLLSLKNQLAVTPDNLKAKATTFQNASQYFEAILFFNLAADFYVKKQNPDVALATNVVTCAQEIRDTIELLMEDSNLHSKLRNQEIVRNHVIPQMLDIWEKIHDLKIDEELRCEKEVWCLHHIEWSQHHIGDYASREATIKLALEIMEAKFGDESSKHQVYAYLLNNLNVVCEKTSQLDKSGKHLKATNVYKEANLIYEEQIKDTANNEGCSRVGQPY